MSEKYTKEQLQKASEQFSKRCNFVISVADLHQLPDADRNEVAFAGRSNVGKSSLINAIFHQKKLAKTSNTPGRTQQLNFFDFDDKLYIVDLPGYGYAKAPEQLVRKWQSVLRAYLRGRPNLRRVFVLIDSRHGIKKEDTEIMKLLDESAVAYQIVLTKTDKISATELNKVLSLTEDEIAKHAACLNEIIATSSEKQLGLDFMQAEICSFMSDII